MQFDRIGRGERAVFLAVRRDHADGADARRAASPSAAQICRVKAATEVLPLVPVTAAMVAGWRGKNFAAASASARRALATCTKATLPGSPSRPLLGGDRHRAGRRRLLGEMRAVGLGAGDGDEQEARLDLAAVGGNAGDLDAGKLRELARIEPGVLQEVGEFHRSRF